MSEIIDAVPLTECSINVTQIIPTLTRTKEGIIIHLNNNKIFHKFESIPIDNTEQSKKENNNEEKIIELDKLFHTIPSFESKFSNKYGILKLSYNHVKEKYLLKLPYRIQSDDIEITTNTEIIEISDLKTVIDIVNNFDTKFKLLNKDHIKYFISEKRIRMIDILSSLLNTEVEV